MHMALLVVLGTAQAAPAEMVPARVAANEVRKVQDAEFAKIFNYVEVQKAYPRVGIKGVVGTPGNEALKAHCVNYVRGLLKTPSVAKFATVSTPEYHTDAGIYYVSGKVDSQNSYGAMIRSTFYCQMIFSGTAKGGTLWIDADVYSR